MTNPTQIKPFSSSPATSTSKTWSEWAPWLPKLLAISMVPTKRISFLLLSMPQQSLLQSLLLQACAWIIQVHISATCTHPGPEHKTGATILNKKREPPNTSSLNYKSAMPALQPTSNSIETVYDVSFGPPPTALLSILGGLKINEGSEKASDLAFRRKSRWWDSSSVLQTDYSKLVGDVSIRQDHSLLIRSTEVSGSETSTQMLI